MPSHIEHHLAYQIQNAPIQTYPFPHFFIRDIFPDDFYAELQQNLPDPEAMRPISQVRPVKGYDERFVLQLKDQDLAVLPEATRAFWKRMQALVLGDFFGFNLFAKFRPFTDHRFRGRQNVETYDDAMLVQDITNYNLGPHTDAPRKVVTLLFYLPGDNSQAHLGTSIYAPKDLSFRCRGGPHHRRENFELVRSMPFVPNSLFGFFKTDNSFHGVEPVGDPDTRRWLLLYDIYVKDKDA